MCFFFAPHLCRNYVTLSGVGLIMSFYSFLSHYLIMNHSPTSSMVSSLPICPSVCPSLCLFSSPAGQLVALQPRQGSDLPPTGHAADPVLRQRLRRKLPAGQEVLRAAHRLPHCEGRGLVGWAHAGESLGKSFQTIRAVCLLGFQPGGGSFLTGGATAGCKMW